MIRDYHQKTEQLLSYLESSKKGKRLEGSLLQKRKGIGEEVDMIRLYAYMKILP